MKKILWWLIAGTKGGINRARIIKLLNERPYNMNQLSDELNLDYKTVKHHINTLKEYDIVTSSSEKKYGALYFLSNSMEKFYDIFTEIWEQIGKKYNK